MKPDYTDQLQQNNNNNNIFTKLHNLHHPHYFSNHHRHPSEEHDTQTTTTSGGATVAGDGATIEVIRRPRGRPPGSKNKPKPPLIITREPESAMRPFFLELPDGLDVVKSISGFTRKRNIGLTILTASGAVTNVSLRQPGGSVVTLHGRFDILSVSATFLQPSPTLPPSSSLAKSFTLSVVGPHGQIIGGVVAGSLITAGQVFVMAASFSNPEYHRLPIEVEEDDEISKSSGGADMHQPQPTSTESMFTCHMPSNVIWASPNGRQPPPPHF